MCDDHTKIRDMYKKMSTMLRSHQNLEESLRLANETIQSNSLKYQITVQKELDSLKAIVKGISERLESATHKTLLRPPAAAPRATSGRPDPRSNPTKVEFGYNSVGLSLMYTGPGKPNKFTSPAPVENEKKIPHIKVLIDGLRELLLDKFHKLEGINLFSFWGESIFLYFSALKTVLEIIDCYIQPL